MQLLTRTECTDRVRFRMLSWRGQNAMRSINRACSNTTFPWLDAVHVWMLWDPLYVHSIARVTNCDSQLKSIPIHDPCSMMVEGCSITVCQFTKICFLTFTDAWLLEVQREWGTPACVASALFIKERTAAMVYEV